MTRPLPGKWIDGLRPAMPITEAARVVLKARWKALERALPPAARRDEDDPEHVHQLRVATRRASAAVRFFKPAIGSRARRGARRALQRIRRAASRARDCDVLRQMAQECAALMQGATERVLRDLVEWLECRRAAAQASIAQVAERYPPKRLRRLRRRLIWSLRQPAAPEATSPQAAPADDTLASLARQRLAAGAATMAQAASADLRIVSNLHALRLQGKRLRYEMEVVAPCLGTELVEACNHIKSMQDRLGALNDAAAFGAALAELTAEAGQRDEAWRAAAARIESDLARELADRVEAFLRDWESGTSSSLLSVRRAINGQDRTAAPDSPVAIVETGRWTGAPR